MKLRSLHWRIALDGETGKQHGAVTATFDLALAPAFAHVDELACHAETANAERHVTTDVDLALALFAWGHTDFKRTLEDWNAAGEERRLRFLLQARWLLSFGDHT